MDKEFEFKRVKLYKDNRWEYSTMIVFLCTVFLTSVGNMALFASTFTTTSSNQMFTATKYLFRWILLLCVVLTMGLALLLLTMPREEFQFDWCFRPKDPQDIVDNYESYNVLGSTPVYVDPPNASLNWKKLNPAPEATIPFPTLEKNIDELKTMIAETRQRWVDGQQQTSDPQLLLP